MGQYKNVGDPFLALAEECSEVIQVITKKYRFGGDWNEIPEGKQESRLQQLQNEMNDLIYQYKRAIQEFEMAQQGYSPIRDLNPADFWDGDDAHEGS